MLSSLESYWKLPVLMVQNIVIEKGATLQIVCYVAPFV